MSVEVLDLSSLQLNLLIKVDLLLSDNVQLSYLFIDDLLSFIKCIVDLFDLVFDLVKLFLGVLDHLVEVLDLIVKVVSNALLLILLVNLVFNIVSLREQLSLSNVDSIHLVEKVVDLFKVTLGLLIIGVNISNIKLEFAAEQVLAVLELVLELCSFPLDVLELSVELLELKLIFFFFVFGINVINGFQLLEFNLENVLLSNDLVGQSLELNILLRCSFLLLLEGKSDIIGQKAYLLLKHCNSLLLLSRSLTQELVVKVQLIVQTRGLHVLLVQFNKCLLQCFLLDLHIVSDLLLCFEIVFGLLGLLAQGLTLGVELLQVVQSLLAGGCHVFVKRHEGLVFRQDLIQNWGRTVFVLGAAKFNFGLQPCVLLFHLLLHTSMLRD